ncbi:MAG TPA: hypothetical protein VEO01_14110 [Pseudonocardiaceae bacterium]|nr:hypothetical protein [Pseudonocardiaceae bacterium]
MSTIGFDLAQLNSTDLLVELVIDTFDQWSIPSGDTAAVLALSNCGRDFASAAALV